LVKITKTLIKKFQREVEQYQEYVEGKRILRWLRKKRKYALREYKPRWWYVQRFKKNYYNKYGRQYKKRVKK